MNDESADGWTDQWREGCMNTQNFRVYNIIPMPLFVVEYKEVCLT